MGLLDELRAGRRSLRQEPVPTPALVFIPDISGFTRFIEESGNALAPWLVADLLEILMEANQLGLEVNEVQGDAILFYRLGPPPAIGALVAQCRRIFLDFQNYLRLLEHSADSDLGAALRRHALTLKIVVHYGPIHKTLIGRHTKLMGREVIVAHRLLKNNVTGSEYVLLSEDYLRTQPLADVRAAFTWTRLLSGTTHYEYLGDVLYQYAHLTPLRLLMQGGEPGSHANAVQVRRVLPAGAAHALRVISNLRLRPRWLAGASAVRYDAAKGFRLGTSYKVAVYGGEIDFQAVQHYVGAERLEYVEKLSHFRMFPNSLLFFFLEEISADYCLLTLEFRYGHIAAPRPLVAFGQLHRLRRFCGRSVHNLATLLKKPAG